ncbi:MAG: PEGA domain-containing protein [Lachnospiraceae bacterium]|nr:PEGA domain-containing protein [Lachnospiraceae bacterium]
MKNKNKFRVLFVICIFALILGACQQKKSTSKGYTEPESAVKEQKEYNASDIAVVLKRDGEFGTFSLKSKDTGSVYTLTYNGGSKIKSKYGNDMLVEKVEPGMIVEVRYIEGTKKLVEMMVSDKAWENTKVVRMDVDYDKQIIKIGSKSYSYDESLMIYSNGKTLDIREISGIDELTVRGFGTKALSVVVNKGHGYIRLKDEDNFVNGIIEVGDKIVTKVTEDMIIAAPEGELTVTVTKDGKGGEKTVTVDRGMETIVSFADFEQPIERMGMVNFIINPKDAEAKLYIDNVKIEYEDLVRLAYGDHLMVVKSNNYDTYTKTISITSAYTTINVSLTGDSEEETETDKENETTKEEETTSKVEQVEDLDEGDEVITVNAPKGASVYFDGVYKGVAPVSFKKQAGEHVIILTMDGYETKMYTIDVISDGEDMEITLPTMLKKEF